MYAYVSLGVHTACKCGARFINADLVHYFVLQIEEAAVAEGVGGRSPRTASDLFRRRRRLLT